MSKSRAQNQLKVESQSGFTLIEILVVLVIMTLALSITVPAIWKSLSKTKLNAFVRELSAACRYARSQSVTTKNRVTISVDMDKGTYTINEHEIAQSTEKIEKAPHPDDLKKAFEKEKKPIYSDDEEAEQSGPYTISGFRSDPEGKLLEGGIVSINFFPLGNSDGGEFLISGQKKNMYYSIRIDRLTGRVSVHEERALF